MINSIKTLLQGLPDHGELFSRTGDQNKPFPPEGAFVMVFYTARGEVSKTASLLYAHSVKLCVQASVWELITLRSHFPFEKVSPLTVPEC